MILQNSWCGICVCSDRDWDHKKRVGTWLIIDPKFDCSDLVGFVRVLHTWTELSDSRKSYAMRIILDRMEDV